MSDDRSASAPGGAEEGALCLDRASVERAFEGFLGSHVTLHTRLHLDDLVVRRLAAALSAVVGRDVFVDAKVNPVMDAGAVLSVGDERQVVLDSRVEWVAEIQRDALKRREEGGLETHEAAYEHLRLLLERPRPGVVELRELFDVGSVVESGDGVALVSGLRNVGSQELVEFEGGVRGIAFSLLRDCVGCVLLGPDAGIREGGKVRRTGHLLRVPVGESLLGRIVNALGEPIDEGGPIVPKAYSPVERPAPGVVERQPVDTPLHTGIKAIDALVPLGRGQRELIIGDRKTGKTTLAVDTILSQQGTGLKCVYVAVGQKASTVIRVVETLREHGAMEYTTVVVALPNEPPAFRYLAPYSACSIAEYFMDQGQDALVIYDDLSKHAITYREMSALLKRPVGREAYPGDVFYVHSRLLERAARLSEERGGGSLTALPIVETQAGDISAFIPTNVISISDGQIVLDAQLFNEGLRPAMDAGLSVSRVGGAAQTLAVKQVAGRLRVDLAQYQEMAQFVKFGAEVDRSTMEQLARGERSRELLKQAQNSPLPVEHEVAVLFAVVNGYLDQEPVEGLRRMEREMFEYLDVHRPETVEAVRTMRELTPSIEADLKSAVEAFLDNRRGRLGASEAVSSVEAGLEDAEEAAV